MCRCQMCKLGITCDAEFDRQFEIYVGRPNTDTYVVNGKTRTAEDLFNGEYAFKNNLGVMYDETEEQKRQSEEFRRRIANNLDALDGHVHEDHPMWNDEPTTKLELKCECGSDKANVPFHSQWCPKGAK